MRVLLVEPDDGEAATLQEVISNGQGVALRRAASLSEALASLEADPEQAVVMGGVLPDPPGLDAVRTVAEAAPGAPVVVLTGQPDEETARAALRAGAEDCLVRDRVAGDDLLRALQLAEERHRVRRALARSVEELREANERLARLTVVDPLTEALDDRGLRQVLKRELQWARRTDSPLLALLVDLDDLDVLNQRHGRSAGDRVLRDVARASRACIRTTDHLGRVGGDEFLVLLPDTVLTEGCLVADRVRLAAAGGRPHPPTGQVATTVSLGLVEVPLETDDLDGVLARARSQLDRARQQGGNRFCWPGAERTERGELPSGVLDDLRRGGCLRPVFQPVVHLESGEIVGYEALTRSTVPGCEMPEDLFALCAEAGLVTAVDQQCFEHNIRAATPIDVDLKVHVNVLPSTLVDLPPEELLRAFPADRPPSGWCVEISEQRLPSDVFSLTAAVDALRESGLAIAIDDIGYGQSSFESLVVLEPDVFKIDKRMVTGLGRAGRGRVRVLERILSVAEALHAEVIAEGVETEEDIDALRRLGVEFGQGFFWGLPEPLR